MTESVAPDPISAVLLPDLTGQRVLITGGRGFIGNDVVKLAVEAGAQVILCGPGPDWRQPVAGLVAAGRVAETRSAAWWAPESAAELSGLGQIDHLIHLGYVAPRGSFAARALEEVETNLAGTLRLVDALTGVGHVALASTARVYRPGGPLPLSEDAALGATDPYGAAKVAAEALLAGWSADTGCPVTVLRFATVYGPMETVPRAVPNFIRAALARTPGVIRGPGGERSDYVYVADAARAVLLAAAAPVGVRTFNVASGVGVSTTDMYRYIADAVHEATADCGPVPPASYVDGAQRPDVILDPSRAQRELGFQASTTLAEGVAAEIVWFRHEAP